MTTPWTLYLLHCTDGSLYTGITTNIQKRLEAHRTGKGSKYVASRGVATILATKTFPTKSEALKAEYAVKQLPKDKKEAWFTQPAPQIPL
ncbi:GIY-YIG nuclease family protein [Candidatus Pacearchaeota archaeon]|nr:GIY-YIG nuclease family protein [Candidatus Pacearchaeota archaeon]